MNILKQTALPLLFALLSLQAGADQTIVLKGDDMMKYDKTKFTVKSGEKVTLVFKNVGKLPKVAMGHNVVILKLGADSNKFAQKALSAQKTDYIPSSEKKSILAKTRLIGGGETDTITFTAPPAGNYPYLCSFPGHFAQMQGIMMAK